MKLRTCGLPVIAGTALLALVASEPAAHAQRVTFTYTGKIVTYKVRATGLYQITAYGAQGSENAGYLNPPGNNVTSPGGLGAEIGGDFELDAGDVLQIAVGGVGTDNGGGGGSFVVGLGNTPLVIAGGGGAGGFSVINLMTGAKVAVPGGGGLTGPDGGGAEPSQPPPNGTNGNGGAAGVFVGAASGGGGGGFLSAGGHAVEGGTGGSAFPGLAGGTAGGGFGGGGGGASGSGPGGGGGYSGGAGGGVHEATDAPGPGQGGGSFDVGTDQILNAGTQAGDGEVVIKTIFLGTSGKPNCHGDVVSALAQQYGGQAAAAAALGYSSVSVLQNAIAEYCAG
jgi:hypothetical protein